MLSHKQFSIVQDQNEMPSIRISLTSNSLSKAILVSKRAIQIQFEKKAKNTYLAARDNLLEVL